MISRQDPGRYGRRGGVEKRRRAVSRSGPNPVAGKAAAKRARHARGLNAVESGIVAHGLAIRVSRELPAGAVVVQGLLGVGEINPLLSALRHPMRIGGGVSLGG